MIFSNSNKFLFIIFDVCEMHQTCDRTQNWMGIAIDLETIFRDFEI